MNVKTQIAWLSAIVFAFLMRGLYLVSSIQDIIKENKATDLGKLAGAASCLESFLYLFIVLAAVIAGPLLFKKDYKALRRKQALENLQKLKKKAKFEHRAI